MTVASTGSCPTCGYPSGRCICSFGTGPWGPFTARTDRIEVRHDPELRTAVIDLLMEIDLLSGVVSRHANRGNHRSDETECDKGHPGHWQPT